MGESIKEREQVPDFLVLNLLWSLSFIYYYEWHILVYEAFAILNVNTIPPLFHLQTLAMLHQKIHHNNILVIPEHTIDTKQVEVK